MKDVLWFTGRDIINGKVKFPYKPLDKKDALDGFFKLRESACTSPGGHIDRTDDASNFFFQKKRFETKNKGFVPAEKWRSREYRVEIVDRLRKLNKKGSFGTDPSSDLFRQSSIRSCITLGYGVRQFHPSSALRVQYTQTKEGSRFFEWVGRSVRCRDGEGY
jgi:hypothetical protein